VLFGQVSLGQAFWSTKPLCYIMPRLLQCTVYCM